MYGATTLSTQPIRSRARAPRGKSHDHFGLEPVLIIRQDLAVSQRDISFQVSCPGEKRGPTSVVVGGWTILVSIRD